MGQMNMAEALNSFSGKRVVVTGHTGFKGSWMTFLLNQLGADVLGYALPPLQGRNHFEMLNLKDRINHVVGDIRDYALLHSTIQAFKPEYVFHLAAQALVRESYDDPVGTFATNVMGSVNLLEAVRHCDTVRSLVYVTSDKCYENVEWVWGYRENDRLGGRDPYSASKASAEMIFSAYAGSYFSAMPHLGAATARAGNVIGGGDWAKDRIIPDCIRALESKRAIELRSPLSTRPWQHVLEPISGYVLLAARLRDEPARFAGSWNFGPSSAHVRTVEDVATSISGYFGQNRASLTESPSNRHEARLLQLNCDKAHHALGWHPRWAIDKTLAATAEWYHSVLNGADAEAVTGLQVREYFRELP